MEELTNLKTDYAVYNLTYELVETFLRQVTAEIDSDPSFPVRLIVGGGAALNRYLPPDYDPSLATHDWDTRLVLWNQEHARNADYINRVTQIRVHYMFRLLELVNRFIANSPVANNWMRRNFTPMPDANFFILATYATGRRAQYIPPGTAVHPLSLIMLTYAARTDQEIIFYSLFDNISFIPTADFPYYYDFIGTAPLGSPIPVSDLGGILYSKIGFVVWDTCRMIAEHTDKYQRYIAKSEALIRYMDGKLPRCLMPGKYASLTLDKPTIGARYSESCSWKDELTVAIGKLNHALASALKEEENIWLAMSFEDDPAVIETYKQRSFDIRTTYQISRADLEQKEEFLKSVDLDLIDLARSLNDNVIEDCLLTIATGARLS